jgi:hypothetical protein
MVVSPCATRKAIKDDEGVFASRVRHSHRMDDVSAAIPANAEKTCFASSPERIRESGDTYAQFTAAWD